MGSQKSKVLESKDMDGVAKYMKSGKCKRVVFLVRHTPVIHYFPIACSDL